jgi:hypothetical protein
MSYAAGMRTTVNLDPEVLAKVRILSRQRREPIGAVISALVREVLRPRGKPMMRNGVPVFPRKEGAPPDLDLVNTLRD